MLASTTSTVSPQRPGSLRESHRTAGPILCPVKDLVECWTGGFLNQVGQQVLLQRLVGMCSALTEDGVRFGGRVLDLDAWHGVILALREW